MRYLIVPLAVFVAGAALVRGAQPPPTFRLFFLGHEIGRETDSVTATPGGARHLDAAFEFVDRGTTVSLTGAVDLAADGSPTHFLVKGRNYRLFTSDSEVTVTGARAHVRDLATERDVDVAAAFFPADNYAPIGAQEELIRYWDAHGQPAEIDAPPAGTVRIAERGVVEIDDRVVSSGAVTGAGFANRRLRRLSIDGLVWGRETAWVDSRTRELVGVATWAGQLPFEAFRSGYEDLRVQLVDTATTDRVADLIAQTKTIAPQQTGTFALVGATVIDATGAAPIADATVVVRDGRIAAVGPTKGIPLPPDIPPIDVSGRFIVPGLWDTHAHASQTDWALPYLAGGVTTIRDMGGEEGFLVRFRDAIASGAALGPRVLLAGLVDGSGPQAFGMVTAETAEEAVAVVRRYHDEHFDQIKIYDSVKPDVVKAITDEAHRLGMTVTGHVPRGMTAQGAVDNGFDQLAHMRITGQPGSDGVAAQIAFFKTHGTVLDPTQSWNELGGHSAATPIETFLPDIRRLPLTLRRAFASMTAGNGDPAAIRARLLQSLQLVHEAQQAGVPVVAGTDKGVPGFSLQREIELYVDGGMTPLEAIQAATIVPARAMKLDRELGTVESGKRADLLVLSENPLDRISNIRSAALVVVGGQLYDAAMLWRAAGYAPR